MTDTAFQNFEGVALVVLVVGCSLWYLIRVLQRTRPEFRIGRPIGVGLGLRLAAIATVSAVGLNSTLRGGDEVTFLEYARYLASQPFGHGYWPHGHYQLHVVFFALEDRLGFMTVGAMRIVQVGIALLGVVLILAAVYDLAGARAAKVAAWLMALEPAAIFFNSALHKEPNMELAAGLVVFGGTMLWKRLDVRGIPLCALGGLIAVETRSYAGWFLVSAAVAVLLHAAWRNMDRPLRAMPLVYAVVIAAFLATPTVLAASSKKNLQALQGSQNANAHGIATGSPNSNNLRLEQVDFSTRSKILANLPRRIGDLLVKPFPWQLSDAAQRFGAIGTLVSYAVMLLLLWFGWQARGQIMARAGPVLYPLLFLLVAYSLAVGNAGTGFRYRSHLMTLAIAAMAILREQAVLSRVYRKADAGTPAETAPAPEPLATPA